MSIEQFISKTANREQLAAYKADIHAPGELADELSVAEIFLWDFECNGTDIEGRNAYSIQLSLDEQDRIVNIQRVGHCHMCGGQGSDDDLDMFPHKSLEDELELVMIQLVNSG